MIVLKNITKRKLASSLRESLKNIIFACFIASPISTNSTVIQVFSIQIRKFYLRGARKLLFSCVSFLHLGYVVEWTRLLLSKQINITIRLYVLHRVTTVKRCSSSFLSSVNSWNLRETNTAAAKRLELNFWAKVSNN